MNTSCRSNAGQDGACLCTGKLTWRAFVGIACFLWVAIVLQTEAQSLAGTSDAGSAPDSPKTAVEPGVVPRPPDPPEWNPVDAFRRLLAMSPAERETALASRSEKQRKYLQEQLQQFEQMSPAERELHLRTLELQWYLVPLLKLKPDERPRYLDTVPARWRELIKDRLEAWDRLPEDQRQEILSSQALLIRIPRLALMPTNETTAAFAGDNRLELELAKWRALSQSVRERIATNFNRLFSLPETKVQRGLRNLSNTERERVRLLIATFSKLPAEQREKCIRAFNEFANMTPDQRNQFLKNAVRWQSMSPEEKRVWRVLTTELPPSPPGFPNAVLTPPMPPALPPAPTMTSTNKRTNTPAH